MPNNVSNVSFASPAYDYAGELTDIERQRKLADALRAAGLSPGKGTQMVGNVAIRNSPLEGVAKVAQTLSGQYIDKQAKERQAALAARSQKDTADTWAKALETYGGTAAKPAIPMPSDEAGGGPDRAAMPAVAGDPMRAGMILSQNPNTAAFGGPMIMDAMKSQKLAQALAGAGFGGSGAQPQPTGQAPQGGGSGAIATPLPDAGNVPRGALPPQGAAPQQGNVPPGVDPLAWALAVANGDTGALAKMVQTAHAEGRKLTAGRVGAPIVDGNGNVVVQPTPAAAPGVQLNLGPNGTTAAPVPGFSAAQDALGTTPMEKVQNPDNTFSYVPKAQLINAGRNNPIGGIAPPAAPTPAPTPQPQPAAMQPTSPFGAGRGMDNPLINGRPLSSYPPAQQAALKSAYSQQNAGNDVNITVPRQGGQSGVGLPQFGQSQGDALKQKVLEQAALTPGKARVAAETQRAQKDADRSIAFEEKIPLLNSTLRRLDRLEQLTKDDRAYSAAGAEIKTTLGSVAQSLGLPIAKEKTANTEEYIAHFAELLKERLQSKDYGSGTAVSNLDLLAAGRPLPEVMKTQTGKMQVIQALKADSTRALQDASAARDYFGKNSSLVGFRYPSETEQTPYGVSLDQVRPPANATTPQRRAGDAGSKLTPQEQSELDALRKKYGR